MMVIYLRDFKLILRMMDFLLIAEVGILPYLGALAFLEQGTLSTVNTLQKEDMVSLNLKFEKEPIYKRNLGELTRG